MGIVLLSTHLHSLGAEEVKAWSTPSPLSTLLFPDGGGIKVTDCVRDDHVSAPKTPTTETGHDL